MLGKFEKGKKIWGFSDRRKSKLNENPRKEKKISNRSELDPKISRVFGKTMSLFFNEEIEIKPLKRTRKRNPTKSYSRDGKWERFFIIFLLLKKDRFLYKRQFGDFQVDEEKGVQEVFMSL